MHAAIELIAIVVSALVVVAGWTAPREARSPTLTVMASTFAAVCLLDTAHLLALPALTPGGASEASRALYIWLGARVAAGIGVAAAAWLTPKAPERVPRLGVLLGVALAFAVAWIALAVAGADTLPSLARTERQISSLKSVSEIGLVLLYAAAAFGLRLPSRVARDDALDVRALSTAALLMAIGESAFAFSELGPDAGAGVGHLIQLVAYAYVWQALVLASFRAPYQQLRAGMLERLRRQEDERFIAQASAALVSSLDAREISAAIIALAAPRLGDMVLVDLVDADGVLHEPPIVHGEPSAVARVLEYRRRFPPGRGNPDSAVFAALRDRQPILRNDVSRDRVSGPQQPYQLAARELVPTNAYLVFPLAARGIVFGAISFISQHEERRYDEYDLALARELAGRVALALDNARHYDDARSEVAERTAALETALDRAERATRFKSEFVTHMAHELRTPLTGILGIAELLSREKLGPLTEGQREFLADLQRSADHLRRVIDDALDLSVIEEGRLRLELETIDVGDVAHAAFDTLRLLASEKQQSVHIEESGEAAVQLGDRRRLTQVAINLLGNAIKFTGEGGTIVMRVTGDYAESRLSVEDDGVGISDDGIARLFKRWSQVGSAMQQRGGSGLGLAVSRAIVEAHHGRITVQSAPGKGSTFTVHLPHLAAEAFGPDAILVPASRPAHA
ncbi:MAG: multi-sensor signal transduction histidine kinase [Gemmatimonadetes bacterium]|nr:multi-sensor signal transduction histidine kinase [Gemmatimonadota bacterium]